jgi:phosphotransferase system  glucose/maltose/N-acetylglucosamine-specific IIC component
MSTTTETRNETPTKDKDVRQEVQELKHQLELQTATQAGIDATQTATTAGAQTTQAAAQAGTWSTMLAGSAGLVVGMFLALALVATRPQVDAGRRR